MHAMHLDSSGYTKKEIPLGIVLQILDDVIVRSCEIFERWIFKGRILDFVIFLKYSLEFLK